MFNEKLRELRTKSGMTQSQLAKELGVSPSRIGNYEQGTRTPDQATLGKISKHFNVLVDYLVTEGEDESADLETYVNSMTNKIISGDTLLFNGKPIDKDARVKVAEAIKIGMRIALEK